MEPVLRATAGGERGSQIAAALEARVCLGVFIQASEIRSRNGRASGCQGAAHVKAGTMGTVRKVRAAWPHQSGHGCGRQER